MFIQLKTPSKCFASSGAAIYRHPPEVVLLISITLIYSRLRREVGGGGRDQTGASDSSYSKHRESRNCVDIKESGFVPQNISTCLNIDILRLFEIR